MGRHRPPPHGDLGAVRWAAIRHAEDHIHIVATLARQDGDKPSVWNDFRRLRQACNKVERQYGLRATAPADRTAAPRPTCAESELADRQGAPRNRVSPCAAPSPRPRRPRRPKASSSAGAPHSIAATAHGPHSRELRHAADTYAGAARPPHGHPPQHSPAGTALRDLARALAATSGSDDDRINRAVADMLRQFADLADAIAHLHATNNRLAQAEAAAAATTRLRRAHNLAGQMTSRPNRDHPSPRAAPRTADPGRAASPEPPAAVAVAQADFPAHPRSVATTGHQPRQPGQARRPLSARMRLPPMRAAE